MGSGWASSCPVGICDILIFAVSLADNFELDLAVECVILQADLVFTWVGSAIWQCGQRLFVMELPLWKFAVLWISLLLSTGKSSQLMLTLVTGSKGNPCSQNFQTFWLEGRKLQWCEATYSSLLLMDEMKGSALAEERHCGCTMLPSTHWKDFLMHCLAPAAKSYIKQLIHY